MSSIYVYRNGYSVMVRVDGNHYQLTPDQAKRIADRLTNEANAAIDSCQEDTQGEKWSSKR